MKYKATFVKIKISPQVNPLLNVDICEVFRLHLTSDKNCVTAQVNLNLFSLSYFNLKKMKQFSCLKNTFLAPESEKKSTMHISVCKLSPIYTEFEVSKIECIYLCFNI